VLTQPEAEALLNREKDAGMAQPVWTECRSPQTHLLFSARLMLGVSAPPYDLHVDIGWYGELVQQHRLLVIGQSGNLARLCMSRQHQDDPHWHLFEDMAGLQPRTEPAEIPAATALADVDALFVDVFVPRLKITNLVTPGRLFP
jgi:hypothetical protein